MILHTILTASMPFEDKDEAALYRKVVAANFAFVEDDWKHGDPACALRASLASRAGPDAVAAMAQAQDLIRHLITLDVGARYSVKQALAHPWMQVRRRRAASASANRRSRRTRPWTTSCAGSCLARPTLRRPPAPRPPCRPPRPRAVGARAAAPRSPTGCRRKAAP